MTNRKANNTILFLTTLGVYLGLVLVGATPVLGHAATSRSFDIRDEVELTDDLDKKSDPTGKEFNDAIKEYSRWLEDFIKNLRKLRSIDEFNDWDVFDTEKTTFSPCPATGFLRSTERETHVDRWLVPAIIEAQFISEHFTWLADCLPDGGVANGALARSSGIKLKYDKAELLHELSIKLESESRATSIHKGLAASFRKFNVEEDDDYALNKVLLKHTSLTFSVDQVFITTRLPRAALEPLLATRAK